MDLDTFVPWAVVAVMVVGGAVMIWRGRQLSNTTVVDAGAPAQPGPVVVEGEVAAGEATVSAPLSAMEVVYAEAFVEVTTTERGGSGSAPKRRTETRDLGKVTSTFRLCGSDGDTEIDGKLIRSLSDISKVAVAHQGAAQQATDAVLQTVTASLGGGRERRFERRLAPGDRLWVRGDQLEQAQPGVRLTGKLRVYGRPPTQAARRLMGIGAAVIVVSLVALALIV